MKKILLIVFVLFSVVAAAQRERMMKSPGGEMKMMKKYFLCILSRGENAGGSDTASINKILNGHRGLMASYHASATIILSGPLESAEALGAYLYDVDTLEEAEGLVKADPAVAAGRFSYKIIPWWVQKETVIK